RIESPQAIDFATAYTYGCTIIGNDLLGTISHQSNAINLWVSGNSGQDNFTTGYFRLRSSSSGVNPASDDHFAIGYRPSLANSTTAAVFSWLDGATGYTHGSLGIQPRSDLDSAQVVVLTGTTPTERLKADKNGVSLMNGKASVDGNG